MPGQHTQQFRSNLPVPMSSFVGRERDIAELKKGLGEYRLVTLTGPGGCGKTRLAYQVAGEEKERFPDGIWVAELGSLSNADLVVQAVAGLLGLLERPGAGLGQVLIDALYGKRVLLVLDNCEHLVGEVATCADRLLSACPDLTILATSREALGVPGEAIWVVPPLSLPEQQPWRDPGGADQTVQAYLGSESVQLFVARVAAVFPEFTLTVENGAWVAEICRRLDGMPLAIELAAARARALSVKQISERLDDRFNLLTAGSRTAPARQQTLAAALDWSYALLSEAERRVLQRLAIFAGGATLSAAEAVCSSDAVPADQVLDLLSRLVDKSLVVADAHPSEVRYRLLETIREYAGERMREAGDEAEGRNRHLDFFLAWAEEHAPELDGQNQLAVLEQYEIEHDNLRAAMDWSSANPDRIHKGLRLAAACGRFWRLHCHVSEGQARYARILAMPGAQDRSSAHARALMYAANLAYLQGNFTTMQPMIEEAEAIWRELGSSGQLGLAYTLDLHGEIKTEMGDYSGAMPMFQEAYELYSHLGDIKGVSDILMQWGWAAIRTGDFAGAAPHLERFYALAEQAQDKTGLAYALSAMGEVAVRLGQLDRAHSLLERSLSLNHERGDRWGEATILGTLGWVALRQGDLARMREMLGQSLALRADLGDHGGMAWCLEKLAEAAFQEGEAQKAVTVYASAAALRAPVRSAMDLADRPDYERILARLREILGKTGFARCWEAGGSLRVRAAVTLALSEPVEIEKAGIAERAKFLGLSKRERETAGLIAQGKSNREIAQAMTVGEKTIETYVTRILNKLGFSTRVQIATWAMEKGLTKDKARD